jgi:hypothetical protein
LPENVECSADVVQEFGALASVEERCIHRQRGKLLTTGERETPFELFLMAIDCSRRLFANPAVFPYRLFPVSKEISVEFLLALVEDE